MLRTLAGFFQAGAASVIVGGQFGSEAKGLAAAIVADANPHFGSRICTTNAGAQAGHTTVLEDGRQFVCYHLPTVGVMDRDAIIYINAGAIIDPDLLFREIQDVAAITGEPAQMLADRISIHPHACVITYEARRVEAGGATQHLGSTQKGVGAALAAKIMRQPGSVAKDCPQLARFMSNLWLTDSLSEISIEIPQGTGLSINASHFFPYCTSRDCWVGQGLTDAGIHPEQLNRTLMVCRTLPIRVGHIFDAEGVKLGDSGPFFGDSREMEWAELPGIEPERTTVTKRVRRIATWSDEQYVRALKINRPTDVLLTFTNYLTQDQFNAQLMGMFTSHEDSGVYPNLSFSWGPKVSQHSYNEADALAHCRKA